MKKIIPVFLVSASLLGGMDVAYAAKGSNSEVWADSQAKEWGDTPDSVKYVLSNVQISRSQGSNGNKKQTDLFSTKWLKEMQRSPSTYRLTAQDQKWVDNVLANAEAKKSNSWKPSNKTPKAPVKRQAEIVAVAPTPKSSKQTKSVFSDDNVVAVKEKTVNAPKKATAEKESVKTNKAESKALPKPVIVAKEKPDLTPVKPKETVKVMSAEDEKAAKDALAEKARLSEQDSFIASLPVITDSDIERSQIDEVKEEVLDMQNEAMEARIQALDEKEAAEEEAKAKAEEEAKDKAEPNIAVIKEDNEKQIIPITEPAEKTKDNMPEDAKLTHVEPAFKGSDSVPIPDEKVSISKAVVNDTSWMSSALLSLGSISIVMFLIVLGWIRRVVSNGTANKYF